MLRHPWLVVVWVVGIGLAADSVGRPLLRRLLAGERRGGVIPNAFQAQLLGLAVLAEAAFLLAAVGLLHRVLLVAGVVVLAAPGVRRALEGLSLPSLSDRPLVPTAGLLLAGLFYLSFLPWALSPVLRHDDNVYHLELPQRYLEAGGLVERPFELFSNMPHLAEILYTVPMAIGDFTAPKVLVFALSGFVLLVLVAAAEGRAGPAVGALTALVFLSGKNIQSHLGSAYVEPVVGAYLLGAALALVAWRRTGGDGDGALWLAGIHLGIAASCKYTAWVFAAVLAVSALVFAPGPGGTARDRGRRLSALALPPALLVLPWLVRSAVVTGNPLFPNLPRIFGPGSWDSIQLRQLRRMVFAPGGGPGRDWLDLLLVPYNLGVRDDFYRAPSTSIALLLLVFGALGLLLARRIGGPTAWIPPAAILGLGAWALLLVRGRYLIAWIPILVLAAVEALRPLRRRRLVLAGISVTVLGLAGWQLVAQRYPWDPPWRALGPAREELLPENHNWELVRCLEALVPPEGKILALWDNRFFFLDREVFGDGAYEAPTGLARLRAAGDPARFARQLANEGVTHVVVHGAQMRRYVEDRYPWPLVEPEVYPAERLARDRRLLASFLAEELELVETVGRHGIFRLKAAPGEGP